MHRTILLRRFPVPAHIAKKFKHMVKLLVELLSEPLLRMLLAV